MTISNVHICSFSGKVSELKPREKRDAMKVLACLKNDPMVSTWDMGEHGLWRTVLTLEKLGYVKSVDCDYPWCKYVITESGLEKLKGIEVVG